MITVSAPQPGIHDSFLQDKMAIADEFNTKLDKLYDERQTLSTPAANKAVPEGEKAARAALVDQVQAKVHQWEGDHNTWGADEVRDGDKVVKQLTDLINNPGYKLSDITGLVNKVLQNPNGNTDYLGGDGHVAASIGNQIKELAEPLQVDATAAESDRTSKLAEVNSKISDLKNEMSDILGTARPADHSDSVINNTYNGAGLYGAGAGLSALANWQPPVVTTPANNFKNDDESSVHVHVSIKLALPESVVLLPNNVAT